MVMSVDLVLGDNEGNFGGTGKGFPPPPHVFLDLRRHLRVLSAAMKTTCEIPAPVFQRAKAISARNGQTFDSYIVLALETRIAEDERRGREKPWMRHAGAFKNAPAELAKVRAAIAANDS
jgi:hypothetical protein